MKRLWYIVLLVLFVAKAGDYPGDCQKAWDRHKQIPYNITVFIEDDVLHVLHGGNTRPCDDFQNAVLCISAAAFILLGCSKPDSRPGAKRLGFLLIQRYFDADCLLDPANLRFWESLRCSSEKQSSLAATNLARIGQKLEKTVDLLGGSFWQEHSEKTNPTPRLPCVGNKSYAWIFQFRGSVPEPDFTAAPLNTLDGYFKDALNNTTVSEKMRYEWIRYETFKTFPMESPVMPSRLARTGFYYSNSSDEVTCYSCNMTYRDWQDADIPSEIHARMSPSCRHVIGIDQSNVPIHAESGNETNLEIDGDQAYATGNDITPSNFSGDCTLRAEKDPDNTSDQGACCAVSSIRTAATYRQPDLADVSYRLDTLENWGNSDKFDIREIANCGFFYSETGLCLRCFSCGEGVRDLDSPSSLWSYHAHTCPYLIQQKFEGRQPLHEDKQKLHPQTAPKENVHRQINIDKDTELYSNRANNSVKNDSLSPSKHITDGGGEGARRKNRSKDTAAQEHIDEVTAQLVDMGFEDKLIQEAVSTLKANGKEMTPEAVLDVIFSVGQANKTEEKNDFVKPKPKQKTNKKLEKESLKFEEEYARLRQQITCKICMDQEACMVIMPCGHLTSCTTCTLNIRKCPICRKLIRRTIRATI